MPISATQTPNLGLWEGFVLGDEPWGDEMNFSLRALDALVQGVVKDKDLTAPPGSPTAGDVYIVGAAPTGAWSGQTKKIARYHDSTNGWDFFVPKEGWRVYVQDEDKFYKYDGSAWVDDTALGGATLDTDGTLAANSDTKIATQKAVKTYVDSIVGANDAMVFIGTIDCSANPNYPAADRGHTYRVSVAGKIGGGSGPNVEIGDILLCLTDNSLSGTHASVGSSWTIIQVNIDGGVIGPASATDSHFCQFDGTTGKLIKGGIALDTDTALTANSDTRLASQKAVKAYADSILASAVAADATMQMWDKQIACSDYNTTPIDVGEVAGFRAPFVITLTEVRASLRTAQTGGAIFTADIKKNGTSILSTLITIDNTERTSETAATAPVISTSSISDDDEITIHVTQIGDGTAKGLEVTLIGTVDLI